MARDDRPRPRTPYAQNGLVKCPRDAKGRVLPIDALARFAEKCRFDPLTGCVLWVGGTTSGRGNSAKYGSFWYDGRRWFAHRWSGVHIHGLDFGVDEAGHSCPHGPNTLCVEHVEAQTKADNVTERNVRVARARQTAEQRQYWLFVQLGIEPDPTNGPGPDAPEIPLYDPPEWLRPFLPRPETAQCPF